MKHNKYENVGVLYETLCTAVLKEISENNNDKAKKFMTVLSNYFMTESEVQKAWGVYHQLLYNEAINYFYADRFLNSLLKEYKEVNNKRLKKEINSIYEEVSAFCNVKNLMNIKTPNYKLFASFKTLIEGKNMNASQKTSCETTIAEHLVNNKEASRIEESKKLYDIKISEVDHQTNKLAETLAIKSFEQKYKNSLNEDQKDFLVKYMTSNNENNFSNWINKRVNRTIKEINDFNTDNINTETREKLYLVSEKLSNFTSKRKIEESDLVTILLSLKIKDSLNLF
jgi:hypothetical protein